MTSLARAGGLSKFQIFWGWGGGSVFLTRDVTAIL